MLLLSEAVPNSENAGLSESLSVEIPAFTRTCINQAPVIGTKFLYAIQTYTSTGPWDSTPVLQSTLSLLDSLQPWNRNFLLPEQRGAIVSLVMMLRDVRCHDPGQFTMDRRGMLFERPNVIPKQKKTTRQGSE